MVRWKADPPHFRGLGSYKRFGRPLRGTCSLLASKRPTASYGAEKAVAGAFGVRVRTGWLSFLRFFLEGNHFAQPLKQDAPREGLLYDHGIQIHQPVVAEPRVARHVDDSRFRT